MEATELMIGDWVQIKGHLDYNKVREYVHTLQHALRLCGFDGLADNFKI